MLLTVFMATNKGPTISSRAIVIIVQRYLFLAIFTFWVEVVDIRQFSRQFVVFHRALQADQWDSTWHWPDGLKFVSGGRDVSCTF